jgi:hypothetical protein
VTDTLVRLSDLKPQPAHFIGPTWQQHRDGSWHLPKKTLGWGILNWMYEYLKSPSGESDEPFIPTLEQARFILWWYAVDERGRFTYRNGVLRRMKGWGKDPMVAAMSFAELCGPVAFKEWDADGNPVGKPRPNAWVQVAAVSQDQTRNTFTLFPQIATEKLKKQYGLDINLTIIYAEGGRMIESVTSSPMALEGKRPTFVILNEIQWWVEANKGHAMYNVLEGNITKSRLGSARYLGICNAHIPGQDSVGERMWDTYQRVLSGDAVDTRLLYDALEAPASCPVSEIPMQSVDPDGFEAGIQALWEALEIARGDSYWLDIETIIDSILDENNPVTESRRKYLNQINAAEDAWMEPADWDSLLVDAELSPGDTITLGFDGSKSGDHTALVACRVSDGLLQVLNVWNPANYNGEIPREAVDLFVRWVFSRFNVVGFRADVKEFESYVDGWSRDFGKKLKVKASPNNPVAFDMRGQTKRFAFDCEKMYDAVLEGAKMVRDGYGTEGLPIRHRDDPILRQHVLAAHMNPTTYDAISIRKASKDSSRKIDAAVCAVLAYASRQDYLMTNKNRSGRVAW